MPVVYHIVSGEGDDGNNERETVMIEAELWVLVDENGDWEVSKDVNELQAEAGLASRMVKVTIKVPTPQAVELEAEIAEEPSTGELKVA